MTRTPGLLPALIGAAVLLAAAAPQPPPPPLPVASRTTTTTVFGNDACPAAPPDEIVVCARLPESERYRIPKKLRKNKVARADQPWASRVATLDEAARAQRPNSCSAVGFGGQGGCTAAMLRQWAEERRAEGKRAGIEF